MTAANDIITRDPHLECTVELELVRLNRQGYDRHGAYYGAGAPLYRAFVYDRWFYFRAANRTKARAELKRLFPLCKIAR